MNRRRARDEENSPLASQLCHRPLFKLNFPETSCHTPIRPETVTRPVQPYLFIINTSTRSILPILSNPIFKENIAKQAYQHTLSTILTHNASDTFVMLVSHSNFTYRFIWNRLTTVGGHCWFAIRVSKLLWIITNECMYIINLIALLIMLLFIVTSVIFFVCEIIIETTHFHSLITYTHTHIENTSCTIC